VKLFLRAELEQFLRSVDVALRRPTSVVIIGGAAAAVRYGVGTGTRDIDTWTSVQDDLADAVATARQVTGLDVPFGKSGIADGPWDFESRLQRALPHLERLTVLVPERHDLVLMKTVRGDEHDLQAADAIHRADPLDVDVLVRRFEDEMGAVIGDRRMLELNFLTLIERLFPERLEDVSTRIGNKSSRTKRER
jgi:hypothetical protein